VRVGKRRFGLVVSEDAELECRIREGDARIKAYAALAYLMHACVNTVGKNKKGDVLRGQGRNNFGLDMQHPQLLQADCPVSFSRRLFFASYNPTLHNPSCQTAVFQTCVHLLAFRVCSVSKSALLSRSPSRL